jgi:hypothetical protein
VELITHGFNHRKATVILFLDIERAFDKVWVIGLIAKLIQTKISPHLIHVLHIYLQHRSFFVSIRNLHSKAHPIFAGVPQGSLLGPTLFNLFINDIPSIITDPNLLLTIYADDTTISARSGKPEIAVRKLNSALALLEPWLIKWRIELNVQKSSVALFYDAAISEVQSAQSFYLTKGYPGIRNPNISASHLIPPSPLKPTSLAPSKTHITDLGNFTLSSTFHFRST